MPAVPQAAQHEIYPVELWGDTLIVRPRGDAAGFNTVSVNSEMMTVTAIAQQPPVRHLLIDLSGANYVGSVVLGSLVQLGQTVKQRGGRIALSGASRDMQDVLRLMKLDTMWEIFPTRSRALAAVATIPLNQKLWAHRQWIGWGIAAVLAIVIYIVYPRPDYGKIYYERFITIWNDYEEKTKMAGEEEWQRFTKHSLKELEPIVTHINRRAKQSRWSQAERFILYCARDHFPKSIDRNDPETELHRTLIRHYIRCAEAVLAGRQIPRSPDEEKAHAEAMGLGGESATPSTESTPSSESETKPTTTTENPTAAPANAVPATNVPANPDGVAEPTAPSGAAKTP